MSDQALAANSWIGDLKRGDLQSANKLWSQYHDKLIRIAHKRLSDSPQRMVDGEDVALSAVKSFLRALDENRAPRLDTEDEIWRLLVTITARKAMKVNRSEGQQKRDASAIDDFSEVEQIVGSEPSPEFTASLMQSLAELSEQMPDELMREIAFKRLEGYTAAEIALATDSSIRTVKRRLAIIQSLLKDLLDGRY